MALAPGTRLGVYDITSPIGSGGMGAVYLAHDNKLGRDVALKILPATVINDPDRVARFRREAQVLALLNHPHIAQIYDLVDVDDTQFLVLELVDGESLDKRIARGAIPVAEALAIAKQIAEALEAAHEKGIIHRDLKPANIALTKDGTVKVLDFGLAKAMELTSSTPLDFANSPTITSPAMMTGIGMILGTPAYMSPEQAKGRPVDKRSDLWAFGLVLMEMLTGRPVFSGGTVPQVIAEILESEPDWTRLPAGTPTSLRTLLHRCLQKNPHERLDSAAAARLELGDLLLPTNRRSALTVARSYRFERVLPWAVTALAGALAVTLSLSGWRPGTRPHAVARFTVLPPAESNFSTGLSVSPDGKHLVAAISTGTAQWAIWVRPLEGLEFRRVAGTEDGVSPFWSPDGRWIGFFDHASGRLKKVPSTGGAPVTIAEDAGGNGDWNTQGQIIYASKGSLFLVSADGGVPVALPMKSSDTDASEPVFPKFLPDGRHFLFLGVKRPYFTGPYELRVGTIGSSESSRLLTTDSEAVYSSGYILYIRSNQLVAQRFDEKTLRLMGPPERIGDHVSPYLYPLGDMWLDSTSPDAVVFQTPREVSGHLTWFDRQGRVLTSIQEPAQGNYFWPAIAPDQSAVAVHRKDPQTGAWDVWLLRGSDAASRLTFASTRSIDAVWSPDGREIAYVTQHGGRFAIQKRQVQGDASEQLIYQGNGDELILTDWSPDGKSLLYWTFNEHPSVWMIPVQDHPQPTRITEESVAFMARFSPDGQRIAYSAVESGGREPHVYIRSVRSDSRKYQISTDAALHPQWRRDGRELYYWGTEKSIIKAVDILLSSSGVRAGPAKVLFDVPVAMVEDNRSPYAVAPDGVRFLFRPVSGPVNSLTVIQHWTELLSK
jgi:eukaryotic-like serine/threonine-protein kinase